ncbi:SusC/RagA family TonB-linked outer membrane protein [Sinomicrobium weinanense]|uniref:TonB-dependent receptor n=1 Tax=Sinomicrobium weinanense TaxID=2842200 RepID=A0A926JTS5_9FLAO|nr:TonB-dependent receptor [Sinomicrobium weinanense]MBC9797174.1 TonB-dependent receptor [Sinomicrobium weinanense]MBU3125850.1 TonB-dependent receptor [Sinomicrobium weinanense]
MKLKLLTLLLLNFGLISLSAQRTVSGTVTDDSGQPLPGVNVIVQGTSKGVVTDFDGNFSIEAGTSDILEFSYVGFLPREVTVGDKASLSVRMITDTQQLDEVVVIGYGISSKKDLVSSVSSVKSDALENQPVPRVDQALQGRAAGVEVTSNNGAPGNGATIRIRGNSSINGNNNPLFVVDGFIVGTDFNLNNININDIESIDVLKDATALSIYGTRGASGVVLITTKSGKGLPESKPVFSINSYVSVDNMVNKIPILGGKGYVDYINEAGQFIPGPGIDHNGTMLPVGMTDTSLPLQYDNPGEVPTTDWIDTVSQTGFVYNTDISVKGRTKSTNYYNSLSYFKQEGVLRNSGLERVTFRSNFDIDVSERFKMGLRLNLSSFKKENNKVNFSQIVTAVLPIRTIYDDEGNFTGTNPISGTLQRNPEADIQLRQTHDLVTNLISNAYFEYELFHGFKLKTALGATLNFYKNNNYQPGSLPERILNNNVGGFAQVNTAQTKDILSETTFTYDKDFGDHSLKLLGGFTAQKITSESTSSSAEGFPNDVVKYNNLALGSDPETYQVSSGYNQRTLTSLLGRLTYGYKSKYIITLVGRQDGSSVFEEGNKYSFFPSAGVAWNVHEENFMKDNNTVSNLKLRGSYGIVGEQGVSAYNSFDLFNPQFNYFNETLTPAVILAAPGSDGLTWETTKQLDLGIEMAFFNNRISLEADYYKKKTEDLLLFRDLPNTAGNRVLENVGSVENKGFEFVLNTVNISNGNFNWDTSFTLSTNKSKVLDLGDEEFIDIQSTGNQGGPSARLLVGEPMPVFFGAEYLGTYKDPQEIIDDQAIGRAFLGSPRYRDVNGDGTINREDYTVMGSPQPDFYGGFRNNFSYKGLSLDIFFQYSYGAEIFNTVTQRSLFGRGDENIDPRVQDRWMEGMNETSDIPRAGTSTNLFNPNSTLNVEDGSFIRLRSVTLSYDIPLQKARLDHLFTKLKFYITGRNLWLLSDFTLGDPEVNSFTAGSGFGSVSQGFATGQYPYARSIVTGVQIEF